MDEFVAFIASLIYIVILVAFWAAVIAGASLIFKWVVFGG